jgi:hypothetical protein
VRLSVSTKKPRLEAPKSRLLARSVNLVRTRQPQAYNQAESGVKEEAPGGVIPGLEERLNGVGNAYSYEATPNPAKEWRFTAEARGTSWERDPKQVPFFAISIC